MELTLKTRKIVRDFFDDECNVKHILLPLMCDLTVYESDEQKNHIDNILYYASFRMSRHHHRNMFYANIIRGIQTTENYAQILYQLVHDNPIFIEFQQNHKKRKRYKIEIIPITNVCKNVVKLNENCLRNFIFESNIKEFMQYLFECRMDCFPMCQRLFRAFMLYMDFVHNSSFVDNNPLKCFTEMMLNFNSFCEEIKTDGLHLRTLNVVILDYEIPNEFLHKCLCEYHVYDDFAGYFPERQERLLFLHENIYNNYTKHHQTNGICTILADEYLVRILCKFI